MVKVEMVDLKAQMASIGEQISARIADVLAHGQFIMGPEVVELEEALSQFCGAPHTVTCGNGTDALQIALMADGIGPGDAVFVPGFTFTATAEAVLVLGARPVFCDIDPATFNLDPESLKGAVDRVRKEGKLIPRAVISVDLFGLPGDYARLVPYCDQEGLLLIADSAQAFGAAQGHRNVGVLAPVTTTSFFPAKPLGCFGDGGALFTDDAQRARLYQSLRAHGKGDEKYDIVRVGLNSRLDTIQAAILLEKLKIFQGEIDARRRIAHAYTERLRGHVITPEIPTGTNSVWAQYSIRSDRRDAIMAAFRHKGLPFAIYYPRPMHHQTAYREFGLGEGSLPISENTSETILSLPMHPYLSDRAINAVCETVLAAVQA